MISPTILTGLFSSIRHFATVSYDGCTAEKERLKGKQVQTSLNCENQGQVVGGEKLT